jgi:hypothetical protein
MKRKKLSAENKWQQTQFNEKMGKYGKKQIKKYCKIQSPRPICVPRKLSKELLNFKSKTIQLLLPNTK